MIHRLFPLIVLGALTLGIYAARGADIVPPPQKPVPYILPASLLLPNWVLHAEPEWRYVQGPLQEVRVYGEDEELVFNEIDAQVLSEEGPKSLLLGVVWGMAGAMLALLLCLAAAAPSLLNPRPL